MLAFYRSFAAAKRREERDASWLVTLGEWLSALGLSRDQWEGILLPWAASLFSGDTEQARGLSARAAMVFAAKALPPKLSDPLEYSFVRGVDVAVRRDRRGEWHSTALVEKLGYSSQ